MRSNRPDRVTPRPPQRRLSSCAVALDSPRSMREIMARLTPERSARRLERQGPGAAQRLDPLPEGTADLCIGSRFHDSRIQSLCEVTPIPAPPARPAGNRSRQGGRYRLIALIVGILAPIGLPPVDLQDMAAVIDHSQGIDGRARCRALAARRPRAVPSTRRCGRPACRRHGAVKPSTARLTGMMPVGIVGPRQVQQSLERLVELAHRRDYATTPRLAMAAAAGSGCAGGPCCRAAPWRIPSALLLRAHDRRTHRQHPQLLDRRPYRPRQVDARRPADPGDRHARPTARWWSRCSIRWTSSASAASPSRRRPCASNYKAQGRQGLHPQPDGHARPCRLRL